MPLTKILFSVHSKHSTFWPSADVKPVKIIQCMQCKECSLSIYTLISMVVSKYFITKSTGSIMLINFGKNDQIKSILCITMRFFEKVNFQPIDLPHFIEYSAHTSKVRTFILLFFLNTMLTNKVGECYLPSIVRMQYFSIIFNEKSVHYTQ